MRTAPFGYHKKPAGPLETMRENWMGDGLRAALWNALDSQFLEFANFDRPLDRHPADANKFLQKFCTEVYVHVIGRPAEMVPRYPHKQWSMLKEAFFTLEWYQVYQVVETAIESIDAHTNSQERAELICAIDGVLARHNTAYRLVHGRIKRVVEMEEWAEIEMALGSKAFSTTAWLIDDALRAMSGRAKSRYKEAVKNSIAAVESVLRKIAGDPDLDLRSALSLLRKERKIHPATADGIEKLCAHASRAAEAGPGEEVADAYDRADARYILITCSAFINLLESKSGQWGTILRSK